MLCLKAINKLGGNVVIDSQQFYGSSGGNVVNRSYKVGGMSDLYAGTEIEDAIAKIDGVKKVAADRTSQLISIDFDPGEVSEEWITRTLNTMGHSILTD